MPAKIVCIVGARPEVIKMAPVVRALRARTRFSVTVLCSGQHRDLLKPLADWFELGFDDDLATMTENRSLAALTARLMKEARFILTDSATILAECRRLLDDERHYAAMARGGSPYGDGRAAERIVDILEARL